MSFHSQQLVIHVLQNYTYADETARLAATGFVAADVGKVAIQTDNSSFWILSAITPTWSPLAGAGAGVGDFSAVTVNQVPFNVGSQVFEDSGATVDPATKVWTFESSIVVPQASIDLSDTLSISEATFEIFIRNNVFGQSSVNTSSVVDGELGTGPLEFNQLPSGQTVIAQPDFSQNLTANPLVVPLLATFTNQTDKVTIKTGAAMTNFRATITDDNTGIIVKYIPSKEVVISGVGGYNLRLGDNTIDFNNDLPNDPPNGLFYLGFTPLQQLAGQQSTFTVEADSVNILGDISGIPFFENEIHFINTTTVPFTKDVSNIADAYTRLNDEHTSTTATTGGVVVTYDAQLEADVLSIAQFTAGDAGVTNPTVETDGSNTFASGDIIQITTDNKLNDGLYEVDDHIGIFLTVRGVGTVATVEDFTSTDFITTEDTGIVTKVDVSIIRTNTTGFWEVGFGSTTGITFNELASSATHGIDDVLAVAQILTANRSIDADTFTLDFISENLISMATNHPSGRQNSITVDDATGATMASLEGANFASIGLAQGSFSVELFSTASQYIMGDGAGGNSPTADSSGRNIVTINTANNQLGTLDTITANFLVKGSGNGGIERASDDGVSGMFLDSSNDILTLRSKAAATSRVILQNSSGVDCLQILHDDVNGFARIELTAPLGNRIDVQNTPLEITGESSVNIDTPVQFADGSAQVRASVPGDQAIRAETLDFNFAFDPSAQTTVQRGNWMSQDGLKLYLADVTSLAAYEYTLTIPFDTTTAVYSGNSLSTIANMTDFFLRPDGTVAYFMTFGGDFREYPLSTPFDLSTAGAVVVNNTTATLTTSVAFADNGLDVYFLQNNGGNGNVLQWVMSTPWDLSTLTDTGNSFVSGQADSSGFWMAADKRSYVIANDSAQRTVMQFAMSTPGDITTSYQINTVDIDLGNSTEICVSSDGKHAYISDSSDNTLNEFDLGVGSDGKSVFGEVQTPIADVETIDFLDGSTQTKAANPTLVRGRTEFATLGTQGDLSAQDIGPFAHFMRADGKKYYFNGFAGTSVYEYNLTTAGDISTKVFVQAYDHSAEATIVGGLSFSPDGLYMYLVADTGVHAFNIIQYPLTTAWDLSTVDFANLTLHGLGSEDTAPGNIIWKPDGKTYFILGGTNDTVYEYDVSIPWMVTSSVYSGNSFNPTEMVQTSGMTIRNDGYFMLIHEGSASTNMYEYRLPTAWDISAPELTDTFTTLSGFVISPIYDAYLEKFYLLDGSTDEVLEYNMPSAATIYSADGVIDMSAGGRFIDLINSDQGDLRFATDIIGGSRTIINQGNAEINIVSEVTAGDDRIDISGVAGIRIGTTGSGLLPTIDGERISRVATTTHEIFTGADLVALETSAGIITIATSENFTLNLRADEVTFTTRFVLEGTAELRIVSSNADATILTDNTSPFISGAGARVSIENIVLVEISTGGFIDLSSTGELNFAGLNIVNSAIIGYDPFIVMENTSNIILKFSDFISCGKILLTDTRANFLNAEFTNCPVSATGPMIELIGSANQNQHAINLVTANIPTGASFIRIDPGIKDDTLIVMSGNQVVADAFFDISGGTTGTFTAVADAAVASTAVTSVTDSSGVARFNFTPGPTLFVDQEITTDSFIVVAYNVTGTITAVGAGFFEISSVPFSIDDTGNFSGDSVTMTEAGTALVDGDTLVIDTTAATDYDGGATVYNQLVNSFQINRAFTVTQAGTWNTSGINAEDPRVLANNNPGFEPSHYIATAFVNNNATANGAIVNNTFTDMVFGTAGVALIPGSTMERFKLIDELNGTFEYTGEEPFDGYVSFDFTSISSGGTVDFRYKWLHDIGAGFVDLTDPVEVLSAIGSVSQSITKTFPLRAVTGDQIKPQITRNSGTSGITTSYATIYSTQ